MQPDAEQGIRERLLKVLRLAQSGVGGERDNAEVLLEKLLRKYSLTLADLESTDAQGRRTTWIATSDMEERTILAQVVIKLFGVDRKVWKRTGDAELGVDVTHSEHSALLIAWDVYRAAFAEARHALVLGFCLKHGLYAPVGATGSEMTPADHARAAHAIALAEALPTVNAPTRRISSSED